MIGGCSVLVICLLGVGVSGTVKRTTGTSNALIGLACIWVVAYASFVSPLCEWSKGSMLGVRGGCWSARVLMGCCGVMYSAVIFSGEIATPRLRAKTNSLG